MASCVFCRIVGGHEPASFVYRDELCSAFLDVRPVTPGHVLVVPNRHVPSVGELDDPSLAAMMFAAKRVDGALRASTVACDGVTILMADGIAAGQNVLHTHLHIFPRYAGDGFGLVYPEGYSHGASREALDKLAGELRAATSV